MARLIGLTGVMRAGKDTVADILVTEFDTFRRVAFADVLKKMAVALDPIVEVPYTALVDHPELQPHCGEIVGLPTCAVTHIRLTALVNTLGMNEAKMIPDVRRLLQRLGTEAGRNCLGQDIWVDTAFNEAIIPTLNDGYGVVITDARFKNELRRIQDCGGEIWRIERPGLTGDGETATHVSEHDWRKFPPDRVIHNSGDLITLRHRVLHAFRAGA